MALTTIGRKGYDAFPIASQWRVTSNYDGDANPIASNWEEADAPTGFGVFGSSMTESSGVFTFPSTGYWFIRFTWNVYHGAALVYGYSEIATTHNDSTWAVAAQSFVSPGDGQYTSISQEYIFDVTAVSTHKVRFRTEQNNNSNATTTGDFHRTGATFIRLGDT